MSTIKRHRVASSRIAAIGYDRRSRELEIVFIKNGETWRYQNIPEHLFITFLSVVSKGRFYDGVIVGKFVGYRVC